MEARQEKVIESDDLFSSSFAQEANSDRASIASPAIIASLICCSALVFTSSHHAVVHITDTPESLEAPFMLTRVRHISHEASWSSGQAAPLDP